MAFRCGYRPGEWEHLQPVEVYAVMDAREWGRSRDMEVFGVGIAWLRAMLDDKTDAVDIVRSFPGYRKEEE